MQIIVIVLLLYLLYRFIVGFVLPVATAAGRIKKQFREMQANQPQQQRDTVNSNEQRTSTRQPDGKQRTTSGKKAPKEDYIDFEEIPVSKKY